MNFLKEVVINLLSRKPNYKMTGAQTGRLPYNSISTTPKPADNHVYRSQFNRCVYCNEPASVHGKCYD